MLSEDGQSEKVNLHNIPPIIKKKIKNDLLIKKYSKKCKITWRIGHEIYSNFSKNNNQQFLPKKSHLSIKHSKTNIFTHNRTGNNDDIEIDVFMEIKKIIIQNELLGYYFFFSKIGNTNYNNMSYTIHKNETFEVKNDLTKIKIKKYQCKFKTSKSSNIEEAKFSSSKNQIYTQFAIKSPEKKYFKKKIKRKSLGKNPSIFFHEKKLLNNYSLISKNHDLNLNNSAYKSTESLDKYNEEPTVIDGCFVPELFSRFSINLRNLSFQKDSEKNIDKRYVDILKKEAFIKMNTFKEKLKLLAESNESSELESKSKEVSSSLESHSKLNNNSSNTNTNSNSYSLHEKQKEKEQNTMNITDNDQMNQNISNDKNGIIKLPVSNIPNIIKNENNNNNGNNSVRNSSKNLQKKIK
jgi:hypothetical protein